RIQPMLGPGADPRGPQRRDEPRRAVDVELEDAGLRVDDLVPRLHVPAGVERVLLGRVAVRAESGVVGALVSSVVHAHLAPDATAGTVPVAGHGRTRAVSRRAPVGVAMPTGRLWVKPQDLTGWTANEGSSARGGRPARITSRRSRVALAGPSEATAPVR